VFCLGGHDEPRELDTNDERFIVGTWVVDEVIKDRDELWFGGRV